MKTEVLTGERQGMIQGLWCSYLKHASYFKGLVSDCHSLSVTAAERALLAHLTNTAYKLSLNQLILSLHWLYDIYFCAHLMTVCLTVLAQIFFSQLYEMQKFKRDFLGSSNHCVEYLLIAVLSTAIYCR